MLSFNNFLSEGKKLPYYHTRHARDVASKLSPYYSGISRKKTRIGGMTYTVTYKNGKAKFTRRMRTLIGKKR